jgi:hypothetical protein
MSADNKNAALIIRDGIKTETDSTLSFGNFTVKNKVKVNDYESGGSLYNLRTHDGITKLEKNGCLLFEAVPGAACFNLAVTETRTAFSAAGQGKTQITLELEPDRQYEVTVSGEAPRKVKSNIAGKISFSVNLNKFEASDIQLDICD